MSRPKTGRSVTPMAFSMNKRDTEVLAELAKGTGLPKSEILRRLIYAYHSGSEIPGLPKFSAGE